MMCKNCEPSEETGSAKKYFFVGVSLIAASIGGAFLFWSQYLETRGASLSILNFVLLNIFVLVMVGIGVSLISKSRQ